MTLGQLTAVGFALLVDEFRRVGSTVADAIEQVHLSFVGETPEEREARELAEAKAAEVEAGRRNEMIMGGFAQHSAPPVSRKSKVAPA